MLAPLGQPLAHPARHIDDDDQIGQAVQELVEADGVPEAGAVAPVEAADKLLGAVKAALDGGARTRDLGGSLSTVEMGDAVLARL